MNIELTTFRYDKTGVWVSHLLIMSVLNYCHVKKLKVEIIDTLPFAYLISVGGDDDNMKIVELLKEQP